MAEDSESSPPLKRSRPAEKSRRRVTFNPTVQERALEPVPEPPQPVTLKEAADIVVHYLNPYYIQQKLATKVRGVCLQSTSCEITCLKRSFCCLMNLSGAVQVVCSLLVSPSGRRQESDKRPRYLDDDEDEAVCFTLQSSQTPISPSAVKGEAKLLITKFFHRVQRCESEADWEHLKPPAVSKTTQSKE